MTTTSEVTISAHALKAAATFATKDCKPWANVRVYASDGVAHVVATDSYRLYHYEEEVSPRACVDVLIPAAAVKACKVVKSTTTAKVNADERFVETFTRGTGLTRTPMGDPVEAVGHEFPDMDTVERLFPGPECLGSGGFPAMNPRYMAEAYKAFDALGMYPQAVHSGEMRPLTLASGWVETGRAIGTGKVAGPGAGSPSVPTSCRLRMAVMPTRSAYWFTEATCLGVVVRAAEPAPEPEPEAAPAVERVEPEAPEACDDGLKEAYALASADPDHVVVVRAFKDSPEPEPAPECEPAPEPEPARAYSQTCVRRDECPERLAYVLWAMDAAGNIAYAVKRYRSASNAVTCGNAYAAEYLMDSPACWGVFKGTDIAA